MEIHIQLAGVKLGPYSAEYVRRSLNEGHLKPSDQARLNETNDWITVEQVLAQLPPSATKLLTGILPPLKPAIIASAISPSIPRPTLVGPASPEPPPKPKEIPVPQPTPGLSPKVYPAIIPPNRVFSPKAIAETGKTFPAQTPPLAKKMEMPPKAVPLGLTPRETISGPIRASALQPTIVANPAKFRPKGILRWGIHAIIGLALLILGYAGFSYWNFPSSTRVSSPSPQKEASSIDSSSSEPPNILIPPTPTPSQVKEPHPDQADAPLPQATTNQVSSEPTPTPAASPTPDPASATLHLNQGDAKMAKGDFDGAIDDYNKALEINPKLTEAICNRGIARQSKGDLDGALVDYTKALEIDPKFVTAYHNRGLARQAKSDWDGAISDYTRALACDTKDIQDYYNRGQARQGKGDMDGALDNLKHYCDIAPPADFYSHYAHLYIWVISARQKHVKDADKDLSTALALGWNGPADDLASMIAQFLLGKIHEYDLISAAASPDSRQSQKNYCEVWYFAGIKRLMAEDQATATDYFRKCLATEQKSYGEYILAQAELKTLEAVSKQP